MPALRQVVATQSRVATTEQLMPKTQSSLCRRRPWLDFELVADVFKLLRIADHHALAPRLDVTLFRPGRQDPADREQRRSGHLGKLFPRKRDFHSRLDGLADALDKPEQCKRKALGHLLRRHLTEPFFQLVQPSRKNETDVPSDHRILREQCLQTAVLPYQRSAALHGPCRARVAAGGLGFNIYRVSCPAHPQQNFV